VAGFTDQGMPRRPNSAVAVDSPGRPLAAVLRAYPKTPAAEYVMKAQANRSIAA
jgi:hypothetical protein